MHKKAGALHTLRLIGIPLLKGHYHSAKQLAHEMNAKRMVKKSKISRVENAGVG